MEKCLKKMIGYARMKIERRARWDELWRPLDFFLRHIETLYWRVRCFTIIECFGDSHVKVFRRMNWLYSASGLRFRTISVKGATAYGIINANSVTGARSIYDKRLKRLNSDSIIIVLLGEIDASFLVWYLAQEKDINVNLVLQKSINHYIKFLNYILNLKLKLIVCSAPLPTADDNSINTAFMSIRDKIKVNKLKKTQMTLKFNRKIREYCESKEIIYMDMDKFALDKRSGTVKQKLINSNPFDHHYEENIFIEMINKCLLELNVFQNWKKKI